MKLSWVSILGHDCVNRVWNFRLVLLVRSADVFCEEASVKVVSDGVIDESWLEFSFPTCLVSEDDIVIPSSFYAEGLL